jgi:hypothetical protein
VFGGLRRGFSSNVIDPLLANVSGSEINSMMGLLPHPKSKTSLLATVSGSERNSMIGTFPPPKSKSRMTARITEMQRIKDRAACCWDHHVRAERMSKKGHKATAIRD